MPEINYLSCQASPINCHKVALLHPHQANVLPFSISIRWALLHSFANQLSKLCPPTCTHSPPLPDKHNQPLRLGLTDEPPRVLPQPSINLPIKPPSPSKSGTLPLCLPPDVLPPDIASVRKGKTHIKQPKACFGP